MIRVCETAKREGSVWWVDANVGTDENGANLVASREVAVVGEDAHKVCDASVERGDE